MFNKVEVIRSEVRGAFKNNRVEIYNALLHGKSISLNSLTDLCMKKVNNNSPVLIKIALQDMIDEGVVEEYSDGQKYFYRITEKQLTIVPS